MVVLGTEPEYLADLQFRLASGQTVYLARFLPGLEGVYHLRSLGPLVEVSTTPLPDPPSFEQEIARWQDGIALLGVALDDPAVQPAAEAWLTLYWQAAEPQTQNVQARLRLVDASGETVWQSAPTYAASNRYPPVAWKDGEVVPDFHAIPILYTLQPGVYDVEASLGLPFSQEIVPLEGGATWATITSLTVELPHGRVPLRGSRTAIAYDGGALLGFEVPPTVAPGSPADLIATWLDGTNSVQVAYALAAPDRAATFVPPPGHNAVQVRGSRDERDGATTWALTGSHLRCGWLAPPRESCILATTQIAGADVADAVASFDNQMLLTEVRFEAGRLQPGQLVDVTLVWQGLRAMQEDYTVFVHLLGPDGRVHGQVDQWPVQGTYPTSTWPVGASIEDRYLVPLDADAPPGSYQVEIGVYLLATNTRLSVFDEQGNPIDDKILLGGLLVLE
jgi:hypothetical protein